MARPLMTRFTITRERIAGETKKNQALTSVKPLRRCLPEFSVSGEPDLLYLYVETWDEGVEHLAREENTMGGYELFVYGLKSQLLAVSSTSSVAFSYPLAMFFGTGETCEELMHRFWEYI
ncbi:hypothetical protein YC2023_090125 [Brassica napus]